MLKNFNGLHSYAKWPRNYLTDSGGFQIVSLDALNKIDENGVTFKSHIDGKEFGLTPERSMEIYPFRTTELSTFCYGWTLILYRIQKRLQMF